MNILKSIKGLILLIPLTFSNMDLLGQNSLPLNFESANEVYTSFGVDVAVVKNLNNTGVNPSDSAIQIVRSGPDTFSGLYFDLASTLDFSTENAIAMKVYSPRVGVVVKMKIEGGATPIEIDRSTTVAGEWQDITWNFATANSDHFRITIFPDAGQPGDGTANSTFLIDDIRQVNTTVSLPMDFESTILDYKVVDFGDNETTFGNDPVDSENTVGISLKKTDAQTFAGVVVGSDGLAMPIPFTTNEKRLTLRVYSPLSGTIVRMKVEDKNNAIILAEANATTSLTNSWEQLVFDFNSPETGSVDLVNTYDKITLFFNFGNTGQNNTYYWDDIAFLSDNELRIVNDVSVSDLVVKSGESVVIPSGVTLIVNGNISNNGAITVEEGATLIFDGTLTGNDVVYIDNTPPSITSDASASLEENTLGFFYTASADEPATFSLGSSKDEALFMIANDNQVRFIDSPDFEDPLDANTDNIYVIDLIATDESDNSSTLEISFTVQDIDDTAPNIISDVSVLVVENDTEFSYMILADENAIFSLGSSKDEALFTLTNDNEIRFATTPDFENPLDTDADNIYAIDLTATDNAGNNTTLEVTFLVSDADETAPTITSATSVTLDENNAGFVYNATANESASFSLGSSKDETIFTLTNGSEIRFIDSPDYENPQDLDADNIYLVDLVATDIAGNISTTEISFAIQDVDDVAPAITSNASASLEENNQDFFYTASADEPATFSLGSAKDETHFMIANDNQVRFINSPDFENPLDANADNIYMIDLIATDESDNSSTLEISFIVQDIDDTAPNIISEVSVSVVENDTEFSYMILADENATFSLGSSKDEALFTLVNDNEIRFAFTPDFENPLDTDADNIYAIDLTATDNAGNTTTLEVTFLVLAADEIAPTITSATSVTLDENNAGFVYNATADESVSFSLGSSKDETIFTLTNGSEIRFIDSPDYENPQDRDADNIYLVDLVATDIIGNISTTEISFAIQDVDDVAPAITSNASASVEENNLDFFYTASADEPATFSLGSSKDEAFFMIANDNQVRFIDSPDFENPLDANADNVYVIDLIATDEFGNSSTLEISFTVQDIDDTAPDIISDISVSVVENDPEFTYMVLADENVTFSLGTSKDEALFSLTNDNEIRFVSTPDFENPLDTDTDNIYTIDLIATDESGNSSTLEISFIVQDIDDTAPNIISDVSVSVVENDTEFSYMILADENA
ncbi:MAG: hypothetical protein WBA74_24235, partial [Cyclobacteriaceae bacterium]